MRNRILKGKAQWICCMVIVLIMSVFVKTPVQAATSISEEEVYERIIAEKANYPEGMTWTNDNSYRLSVTLDGSIMYGYGCAGFAFILSDAGFGEGEYPARTYEDYSNIRVGDILRINNDTHSVVVLNISGDVVTIAEGNYASSIHWGRTLSLSELQNGGIDYGITRYPVEYSQETSGTCGDALTWDLSDSGVLTVKGTGAMQNWTASVGAPWYAHTAKIKTVVIESGVTSIGSCAFTGCTNLTEVQIASTVTSLGADAFYGCENLKAIDLPNSITEVGNYAFYGCTALEDVTLSNELTTISQRMFAECKALKEIEIPSSVTKIDYHAFNSCDSLNYLYIPNTVTTVTNPYQTFSGITIFCEDNAPVMQYEADIVACSRSEWSGSCGDGLTYNFEWETKTLTITGTGEATYDKIFDGYNAVKYITLKDFTGTELPTNFYGWENVESFEIPDTVTTLNYNTFALCDSMQYVVVPRTVTDILSSFWGNSDDFVIRGYKGSEAEAYAAMEGIKFEALQEEEATPPEEETTPPKEEEATPPEVDTTPPKEEEATPPEFGWFHQGGKSYWYENGVRQGLEGRGKEIYDPESKAWYWLDSVQDGAVAKNKDVYQESAAGIWGDNLSISFDGTIDPEKTTGKWVHYDENGHMVKGWYTNAEGNTYFFDYTYGTMMKGYATIDGTEYYFNTDTGVLERTVATDIPQTGWKNIDGNDYWYENYQRMGYSHIGVSYRGKEIYDPSSDAWYWLDNVDGGKKAVSKDVYQESDAGEWGDISVEGGLNRGKWVRYDENGHMIKGWSGDYYFDQTYGTMAKGDVVIDGNHYYFDPNTGIRQ